MSWIQKTLLASSCMVIGLMVWVTFFGDHGIEDLTHLRQRLHEIVSENQKILQDNKLLAATVDRLKHDPDYIEDMARQTLKLVRKGDIIIEVIPSEKNTHP
jgi:cell division protein FtsB